MKIRTLTIALLAALILVGCGVAEEVLDDRLDVVEDRIDAAGDRLENRLENALEPKPGRGTADPVLTEDEAVAIALEDAGLAPDQISALRTEYEIDDGVPQYEIEFRLDRQEYDYTVHADDGRILARDWND